MLSGGMALSVEERLKARERLPEDFGTSG